MPEIKRRNSAIGLLLLVVLIATMGISCGKKRQEQKVVVAKVYDKFLYLSDIKHIFPDKVSLADSLALAKSYITSWVKNQLLVNKAELNLTPEELDISEQLETYRSSLLIFKYEERLLKEKLDTVVKDDDLDQYYSKNAASFVLDENLVKAIFIKVPKNAPDIENLRKWYKSEQHEDIKKLDTYCYTYATKYDSFKDNLISIGTIQNLLPQPLKNADDGYKAGSSIEQEDKDFLYLVYIKEFNPHGAVSPFIFVKSRIKDIIINKRRVKFLTEIESKIYNDAQDHSNFVIYNIDKKVK
jgi:hypothetical protein